MRVSKFHHLHPNVYHVNFLVGTDDVAAKDDERKLFFAEFWESRSAKPSICCPLNDCGDNVGRCSFCEEEGSKIAHPPSGGYHGDFDTSTQLVHYNNARGFDFEGLMDVDYVYFDLDSDVELAKILNNFHEKKAIAWSMYLSRSDTSPVICFIPVSLCFHHHC